MVVPFRKCLDFKIKTIFLEPNGKLVVLDMKYSDGGAFIFLAASNTTESGWSEYFKSLEVS